jgi:hypothetical protein
MTRFKRNLRARSTPVDGGEKPRIDGAVAGWPPSFDVVPHTPCRARMSDQYRGFVHMAPANPTMPTRGRRGCFYAPNVAPRR